MNVLQVSWSKIVALFAFGARLAQYCQEHQMQGLVLDVASHLSQFAVERLTPFLKQHGGWVSFFLQAYSFFILRIFFIIIVIIIISVYFVW